MNSDNHKQLLMQASPKMMEYLEAICKDQDINVHVQVAGLVGDFCGCFGPDGMALVCQGWVGDLCIRLSD